MGWMGIGRDEDKMGWDGMGRGGWVDEVRRGELGGRGGIN